MCGIAGILNASGEPVSEVTLRAMTQALAHRGPDGEGHFVDGPIGLGHRRLAIIDLSPAAHQPMVMPEGDMAIVYNGEVYNFRELRTELESKGHRFRSRTDSEVVLHAYKEWGAKCLDRFNGMFAFGVWDRRRQELFLARDRYGIKPLYFAQVGPAFIFASEVKAFLKHPAFKVEVSLPHLLEYFTFQNIFTDGTLFKGVKLLKPGHYAVVSGKTGAVREHQYWDFTFAEENPPSPTLIGGGSRKSPLAKGDSGGCYSWMPDATWTSPSPPFAKGGDKHPPPLEKGWQGGISQGEGEAPGEPRQWERAGGGATTNWDGRARLMPSREEEYAEELDRLFRQAVRRQLVSDVPVGAYLSGGMDSGSITAIAAREMPYLTTFTAGFDLTSASGLELGSDERKKAEALSYLLKTEHYEVVLKAGDMERCLEKLVWHLEDLRVGQSYPNFYAARLAGKFVKVVLSGAGGDELFAGYPWRYYRAVVNDDFDHYVEKYYTYWHRLIPNRFMPELFRPEIWKEIEGHRTIDIFRSVLAGHAGSSRTPDDHGGGSSSCRPNGILARDAGGNTSAAGAASYNGTPVPRTPEEYVNQSLYFEAKTFLHGLLVMEDKLSMAHGLETRVPLLDNDLVDFACRVPVRLKLRDLERVVELNENEPGDKTKKYFENTRDGKLLLRQVMSRYVPDVTTGQVKQGFSGPDATWFKGESIEYVRSMVNDKRSRIYDYFQPKTVQALVEEHTSGRTNRRLFIWSLLNFDTWVRTFVAERR